MRILKWATCVAVMAILGCERSSENVGAAGNEQGSVSSRDQSGSPSSTPDNTGRGTGASTAPDNTGRNVRDRSDAALTPEDQGGSEADRETTRKLRRAITSNDQLSTEAKNIKIITTNGKVTLRGPVKNRQDLDTIQSIVQQAGVGAVDNQLEVKEANQ